MADLSLKASLWPSNLPIVLLWPLIWGFLLLYLTLTTFYFPQRKTYGKIDNPNIIRQEVLFQIAFITLLYWLFGYGFMYGNVYKGLIGTSGFLLSDYLINPNQKMLTGWFYQWSVWCFCFGLFRYYLKDLLRPIPFIVLGSVYLLAVYAPIACWLWGGDLENLGGLRSLGVLDEGGYLAIFLSFGGFCIGGIVGSGKKERVFLKKRFSDQDEKSQERRGYLPWSLWPMVFILFLGSASFIQRDVALGLINITLIFVSSSLSMIIFNWIVSGKWEKEWIEKGAIIGLVSSLICSGQMAPTYSFLMGGINAGIILLLWKFILKRVSWLLPYKIGLQLILPAVIGSFIFGFVHPRGPQINVMMIQTAGSLICLAWSFFIGAASFKLVGSGSELIQDITPLQSQSKEIQV